ncbi:MAG: alpha/beta hydrolase [Candidatus Moranbacteria bacterium]|nr:alpha/beta hydrolase [Candidatus Moranbacteria bacterium]
MISSQTVKNKFGEKIDLVVEGNTAADTTVVLVHGFGTGKDEDLLLDISDALKKDFRIVRFDFSGCGQSEGRQEDIDIEKMAFDLEAILSWVERQWAGNIGIIAQSMGTFAVSFLSPSNIEKTIFTGIPNGKTAHMINRSQNRMRSAGGKVDPEGVSIYPRTSGRIQKVGPNHWRVLREFDPIDSVRSFSQKTKLIIFKPLEDEVIGSDYCDDYRNIETASYVELHGSHNFSKAADRKKLIDKIKMFI